jgi:RNA polymerase-binding transcription factor DksA
MNYNSKSNRRIGRVHKRQAYGKCNRCNELVENDYVSWTLHNSTCGKLAASAKAKEAGDFIVTKEWINAVCRSCGGSLSKARRGALKAVCVEYTKGWKDEFEGMRIPNAVKVLFETGVHTIDIQ